MAHELTEHVLIIPAIRQCKLYAGLPTLTQAEANRQCAAWIAVQFRDLDEAIEASWRLDHAVPLGNVPWIIECDDGQRLERHEIRQRYQRRP